MEKMPASMLGVQFAASDILRALISTHPNQPALKEALLREREKRLAFLLHESLPEPAIEAYWLFFESCGVPMLPPDSGRQP